jgi:hypothetical protein
VVTELLVLHNGSYGGVKKMTGFDSPLRGRFWIIGMGALVILLLGTSAYSVSGLVRERRHTQELTASNEALTASLRQMQNQLQLVSEKLNVIAAPSAAIPPPAPGVRERPKVRTAARPRKATQPAEDARWRLMRTRLADQQKQIDTTRQETSQARKELQDNLNSTRDELGGAIAKTHDELAVLQKRGERNYYEFQIDKSRQFHAAGPLSLSLRKVNVKQGYYDVVLVVDDRHLEKKHANLYEPLMFTLADRPQPVDLVVNQISNNQVKGYVSEPKYKKTDLAAASPGTTHVTNDPKALQRR